MSKLNDIKLVTLDTETAGLSGDIRRIAIYDGKEVYYGYTFLDIEPQLIRWYEEGYSVHVYIHNTDFDLRKMKEIFEFGNVNWNKSVIINGKYVKLVCKYYTFHDSFRLLPMSLDSISKNFDVEHGKLDLWDEVKKAYPGVYKDKDDFFRNVPVDDELYLKYLGYDVMSLFEVLLKLLDVSGLTLKEFTERITTANLSKYIFRKGWNGIEFREEASEKTDFEIITDFKQWSVRKPAKRLGGKSYYEIEQIIREGYYGGRTEVFRPRLYPDFNRVSAYHFDINSLYPYVMHEHRYPYGMPSYYTGKAAEQTWRLWLRDKEGLGFITAEVYVKPQYVPPLPCKKGKLAFITGAQVGTWTFAELEYAIKECDTKVLNIKEVVYFKKTAQVFKRFVETFYQIKVEGKQSGNKALTQFAKLLLNVGYGYLALQRDRTDYKNLTPEYLEKYRDTIKQVNHKLGYIEHETFVISDTVQVAVAAYVTSYARLELLKMMKWCEKHGDVYYCDTDSIVTSIPLPNDLIDPIRLGAWDLEGELLEGYFLQPKVYYEEKINRKETVKFKGVAKNTQAQFDKSFYSNLYMKMQEGKESKILVEKQRELLRSLTFLQKNELDWNMTEIRDKYMYLDRTQKRVMDFENNTTIPYHTEKLSDFNSLDLSRKLEDIEEVTFIE